MPKPFLGKPQKHRVGGVIATTVDGRTWTWSVGPVYWRWCRLGHLEVLVEGRCGRINYWKSLDAAIAWTIGYGEGREHYRRGVPELG